MGGGCDEGSSGVGSGLVGGLVVGSPSLLASWVNARYVEQFISLSQESSSMRVGSSLSLCWLGSREDDWDREDRYAFEF